MNLVIVESPTKTKSLSKYLGSNYNVLSSKGHVIDLPKSELGVDVAHGYAPQFTPIKGKGGVINELKKAARKAQIIYLATDLDREGEAIAWHIAAALDGLNKKGQVTNASKFKRVVFSEITKDAILEAFAKPRGFDYHLVNAYQARRVLDRLVGYQLSPLLWKKIMYGLSAGRVQSIAVRLIVERENERREFKSQTYYRIQSELKHKTQSFTAELDQIDGKSIETKHKLQLFTGPYTYSSTTIDDRKRPNLLKDLDLSDKMRVLDVTGRDASKSPYPPFTTASLQRAAQTFFGFSAKQTMRLAQNLYEGGFITYHRTDSINLAENFIQSARSHIDQTFGHEYLPPQPKHYKTKKKGAQEAHEAIRPTQVDQPDKQIQKIQTKLDRSAAKLFELIWKRAVACQAAEARFRHTTIRLQPVPSKKDAAHVANYIFLAKGTQILFDGYRKILGEGAEENILPKLTAGDFVDITKFTSSKHQTAPPPRYTEASLIKALEEHEIGRPSTYAPTIDTIQNRGYVIKENGSFIPEDVGAVVTKLLADNFPEIVDLQFTAEMENKLDQVAAGKLDWTKEINTFYQPFAKELDKADKNLTRDDYKILEHTKEKCPECGHPIVLKLSKTGKFYSCSDFPKCKYAKPYLDLIGLKCLKCKEGEIIFRRTRFGKKFFGCSRYPDCDWASWNDPRDPNFAEKEAKSKARREKMAQTKKANKKSTRSKK